MDGETHLNGLSLCAGIGGLELGLRLALGARYRTVCYVEREVSAACMLVARMADAALDSAPVWDDLTTFDGRRWSGVVDIITAGFPCQPWSVAGERRGTEDERWVWPEIARIIREVEPGIVFLENVPGLANGGVGHVLGDLAEAGFDAEWDLVSAAECGAPHKRERLFILAYSAGARGRGLPEAEGRNDTADVDGCIPDVDDSEYSQRRAVNVCGGCGTQGCDIGGQAASGPRIADSVLADAEDTDGRTRGPRVARDTRERRRGLAGDGEDLGNASGQGLEGRERQCADELPPFPPGPTDTDAWGGVLELDPTLEPAICDVADGVPAGVDFSRTDRLRAGGNAVVPIVAAKAFVALAERAGIGIDD